LLKPVDFSLDNLKMELSENHPSEVGYYNVSFEYTPFAKDKFSDINGQRPSPWGGEVFAKDVSFLCSDQAYEGEKSFKIIGYSKESQGAIAVPHLEEKPLVEPGGLYYLSFWVKYKIEEGNGFRLTQQFFVQGGNEDYPCYACYGPWINGESEKEWSYFGFLVRAPEDSWKGDPVLILSGKGYVLVDSAYFGRVKEALDDEDV
jgi:hypothetical protein